IQRDEPGTGPPADEAAPAPASPPPADSPGALPAAGVAPAAGQAIGSLRVDAPGEGAITFDGFGPAAFGASAEAVRQAWGGDLGDAQPDEQGGCHYLIPQPLGPEGYRTAFMIEGNRFVRVDVRDAGVTAPG